MVIGSVSQKIQTVVELAEELYERVTELREQVAAVRETVEDTHDRVGALERDFARQEALLEAIAEDHGIDPDDIVED